MTRIVPPTLISGDSWSTTFTPLDLTQAPSAGWTLTLSLRGATNNDFAGTTSTPNTYALSISNTQATYTTGVYQYIVTLSQTGQRLTIESGQVIVQADITATDATFDPRTHEKRMLDFIENYIELRASGGQIDHVMSEINGMKLQRMSANELTTLRNRYKLMVMRQTRGSFPKRITYNFNGSGI
jgi:hypothetical protein